MLQPEDANTNRFAFVVLAHCNVLSVPRPLTSRSVSGFSNDARLPYKAAKWITRSGPAENAVSRSVSFVTLPSTNLTSSGSTQSMPALRLSSTVTDAPRFRRRRTRLEPIQPAPPVINTRFFSYPVNLTIAAPPPKRIRPEGHDMPGHEANEILALQGHREPPTEPHSAT